MFRLNVHDDVNVKLKRTLSLSSADIRLRRLSVYADIISSEN